MHLHLSRKSRRVNTTATALPQSDDMAINVRNKVVDLVGFGFDYEDLAEILRLSSNRPVTRDDVLLWATDPNVNAAFGTYRIAVSNLHEVATLVAASIPQAWVADAMLAVDLHQGKSGTVTLTIIEVLKSRNFRLLAHHIDWLKLGPAFRKPSPLYGYVNRRNHS